MKCNEDGYTIQSAGYKIIWNSQYSIKHRKGAMLKNMRQKYDCMRIYTSHVLHVHYFTLAIPDYL